MNGAVASEIALGLLVVRLVLPLCILVGVIWAHVRISIANRSKVTLPADMKAKVSGLSHQVSELDESLKSHQAKHAGRLRLAAKEAAAAGTAAGPVDVALEEGTLVPAHIWNEADAGQRAVWEANGLQSA